MSRLHAHLSCVMRPGRVMALCTTLLLSALGCDEPGRHAPAYDGPVLLLSAPTSPPPAPRWTDSLPAATQQHTAGEQVWAAVPSGERRLEVAVYRVVGQFDGLLSLLDHRGQRVDAVPPALVHRAAPLGKLRKGDVVLCSAVTAPGLLGRVTSLKDAIYVTHWWGTRTRETAVDHAERPRQGIAPMAYASFPRDSGRERGLIVALGPQRAWLRDGAGAVVQVPRAQLQPLQVQVDALAQGQAVIAYNWTRGMRPGEISEVLEPQLRYRVRYADGSSDELFFTRLQRAP